MAYGSIIQEQRAIIGESFRDIRAAWNHPELPTIPEMGLVVAEVAGLAAIDIGVTVLRKTVEVAEEGAWRSLEAARNGLGLYSFIHYNRRPDLVGSLGYALTGLTFNKMQDILDKHGRNGAV